MVGDYLKRNAATRLMSGRVGNGVLGFDAGGNAAVRGVGGVVMGCLFTGEVLVAPSPSVRHVSCNERYGKRK